MKLSSVMTAACVLAFAAPAAVAQDRLGSPNDERFRLSAGVFAADSETEMRLDSDAGAVGTRVTAEDDLGLRDHSDTGDVEVETRIRDRHRVRFNYFKTDRTATEQLNRQIQFGNDLYQINDLVTSRIDIRNFGMTYSYEFLRKESVELGASFGISLAEFNAEAVVPARGIREEESRAGPIPTIGVHSLIRFARRIHAELRGEYLQLHVNDFEGTVINLRGAVVYRFNRNLGVGLGYTLMETEVISEDLGDTGTFRINNAGGVLFLRVAF